MEAAINNEPQGDAAQETEQPQAPEAQNLAPFPRSDAEQLGANRAADEGFFGAFDGATATALQKAGIADPQALANNWLEAQTALGGSLRIPTEAAGEEQWQEFYDTVKQKVPNLAPAPEGYIPPPANASEYGFEPIEGFEEDPNSLAEYAARAHELGLNAQQARGVREWLASNISEAEKQDHDSQVQQIEALQKEWGPAFESQVRLAQTAAAHYLDEGTMEWLNSPDGQAIGNHPMMIKMFAEIGKTMNEPDVVAIQGAAQMTPADAQTQIADIEKQLYGKDMSPSNPNYQSLLDERARLYAIAFPNA